MENSLFNAHTYSIDKALSSLESSTDGLSVEEAKKRLERFGPNALPQKKKSGFFIVFLRQFLSPLIYILLLAAIVTLFLHEKQDAIFIFAVLLLNAIIGSIQEFSAERSAEALRGMVVTRARVLRDGEPYEIDADELVVGDIVLIESGSKVPADTRVIQESGIEIDESLLTGESTAVGKREDEQFEKNTSVADRKNMAFAGTLVTRGRARGVVVGTGFNTEIGRLAETLFQKKETKPPLLVRMDRFAMRIALFVLAFACVVFLIEFTRGTPIAEILLLAVALAVSAIPEGLPVALTVAMAIGMRRMSKRNVIVRRLPAVESLGSCTYIASDKTGTLTLNELTVKKICLPGQDAWDVTGGGLIPDGKIKKAGNDLGDDDLALVGSLCEAGVLCNEASLVKRDGEWKHHGDAVDIALLVLGHKAGLDHKDFSSRYQTISEIPFESERKYAATLHHLKDEGNRLCVKGALERVLPMCKNMKSKKVNQSIDTDMIEKQAHTLAEQGYRVLALAEGYRDTKKEDLEEEDLHELTLLGLMGMIDPLRPEAKKALVGCHDAGIEVAMVTGDHPVTALAIARELGFAEEMNEVVTGKQISEAENKGEQEVDDLIKKARVFARVEPTQKLKLVKSLIRNGHFVAVTGDGANDAPALHAAHVGVAMGKKGTDVARESSELIITDDNFASITAGIEEGRIAYGNARKVIFLLVSTGAAEIILFLLALIANRSLPLVAVQLLWLNLITNGIQDVALAFEPGEGDEMKRKPRSPKEPVFNRIMIERTILSALVMGGVCFGLFFYLRTHGVSVFEARNSAVMLMVLFENLHVFNCRSETKSIFKSNLLKNPILLFGTLAAQGIHVGAMYIPGLNTVLGIQPISLFHWLALLGLALTIVIAMEIQKWFYRRTGH